MNFKEKITDLFEKKTTAVAIFLIIVLGLIIYANSLTGQFIWDDEYLVQKNVLIRNWSNLPKILTNEIGAGAGKPFNYYRPLHVASYIIDYSLWGLNVIGYHLTSVILHILVTLCLYWFILLLYNNKRLSLITSILFLTTPINVETIASISVRGDILSVLFMLLCFIFYIKLLHENKINLYILMLLSYILALLAKENSLIFPALLLLYHYTFKEKIKPKLFIPITIIATIYLVLRLTVLKAVLLSTSCVASAPERIPGFFVAITNYLRILIVPFNLHAEYGEKLFALTSPKVVLGVVLSLALLTYGFMKKKNNGLIFFSVYWFFITLLPVSNIYPLAFYMTEHWLYLPSIGFFLLLAHGLNKLLTKDRLKVVTIAFIVAFIIFYSYLTIRQNDYWKEPMSFFQRTLKYTPDSPRINNNLGTLYTDMGRYEEAIDYLNRAIHYDPLYVKAYNNLGNVYYKMGDRKKTASFYEKALKIDPNYEEAYYNLGIVYNETGMKEKAIALFKKAIEVNPEYVKAYNNLAVIYMDAKKYEEAIALLNDAVKINPYYAEAYNNLGILYFKLGEKEKAQKSYKKAIKLNPKYAEAHNNLGLLYYDMGIKEESILAFKKAIEVLPTYVEAYNNLGTVYRDIGEMKKAIEVFDKAVEINPKYALAYYNLSLTYFFEGQYKLAVEYCDKAEHLGFSDPLFSKDLKSYR